MADRYWVGGAGTWNTSSTTNWSATSGGASGASVPTSADDVYFNSSSGTPGTVTMTGALNCRSITTSVSGWTFATGTSPTLSIYGSLAFTATTTWSMNGFVTFASTATGNTITTNGTTISGAVFFNGTGGGWTLGSAFTTSSGITHSAGALRTAGYSISATVYNTSGSTARSLILDSSTFTLTTSGSAWIVTSAVGMTFQAGTSTITFPQTGISFTGGGLTYYNVTFSTTTSTTHTITDSNNTFYNLTITPPSSPGIISVKWDGKQTITGPFTVTGGAGNRRVRILPSNNKNLNSVLALNGSCNLSDVDFQDILVTGAGISGTRIGNLGGCSGVQFSTAKTVYWNLAGSQNWSATGWAATSGGTPADSNFPLPQDTAVFDNTGSITTITLNSAIAYVGTVDMSSRTVAMTVSVSSATSIYGNWKNGTGTTITGSGTTAISFAGRTTQTITSNGIGFGCYITVNSPNGTVQQADALTLSGVNQFTLTNGKFDTKGYSFSADRINSVLTGLTPVPRILTLNNSTLTLSSASTALNLSGLGLYCNAGTSTINCSGNGTTITVPSTGDLVLYNLSFTNVGSLSQFIFSNNFTVNNLTFAAPSSGIPQISFAGNVTVLGTITCSGSGAVGRFFLYSNTLGAARTLTVKTFATASDIDFRDITLAGTATGLTGTRLGDCGGNTGITFTAAKTVYWNLVGANNWSSNGWCTSNDGGATFSAAVITNFPLAQDTVIINNTSAGTSLTIDNNWNLPTINTLTRTSAFTISSAYGVYFYGSLLTGSGVTLSFTNSSGIYLNIRSSATWTSNGTTWITIYLYNIGGTLTLGDALSLSGVLYHYAGTFDASSYNVTANSYFANDTAFTKILNMGSGTWSLTGSVFVWQVSSSNDFKLNKQTANIILTSTASGTRYFVSSSNTAINKLTIGGATGSSTTNIYDGYFTELASTKTVAHTVQFNGSIYTNAWTITGTAGNVVTITGNNQNLYLLGNVPTGIDYLSVTSLIIPAASVNFYVGANSTLTTCTGTISAAVVPVSRTLFWVGGTGNWSDTTKWATSSGGAGGNAVPTALDSVTFNTASNATGYTVTIDITAKCASCNFGNPASGILTIAGSSSLNNVGALTFGTSTSVTFSGNINFLGTGTSNITANGILSSSSSFYFYNGTWTLAGAISVNAMYFYGGTFNSGGFSIATVLFNANNYNTKTINLGASTIGAGNTITTADFRGYNTTLNAGTSTIGVTAGSTFSGFGYTYYNLTVGAGAGTNTFTCIITGANTFNNLTASGPPTIGTGEITFDNNQTIAGTLTCSGNSGVDVRKMFIRSATIGTQITLTCNAVATPTDCNYRDVRIAGNAVVSGNITGTRLGDAGGNSGITFDSPKSVFWIGNLTSWWTASWSTTSGGAGSALNFPLPQDTAVFDNNGSPGTLNLSLTTHCSTVDFSARTSALTLNWTNNLNIYGNLVMSSAISCTNMYLYFSGRTGQTVTSAGVTLGSSGAAFVLQAPGGTVRLNDNLNIGSNQITVNFGTFDASTFNVTANSVTIGFSSSVAHSVKMGTGTWTLSGVGDLWTTTGSATDLYTHDPGTSNLILSNNTTSAKTLTGTYLSFNKLTLSGSAVCVYSIGNGSSLLSFNEIASTRTGAATINITYYALSVGFWSASGTANNLLTIAGNNNNNPGTIICTGTLPLQSVNYLAPQSVYALTSTISNIWYVGSNSDNTGGGLGFTYTPYIPSTIGTGDLNPSAQVILSSASNNIQTYTMPSDWSNTSNTIEGIGPGGSGSGRQSITIGGNGGGGGSYSRKNIANLVPSTAYYYLLPPGSSQKDTWFNDLNLITNSSSFVNTTSWTTLNTTITSGITDPFGGITAIKLQDTSATGNHYIRQLLTLQTGGVSTPVTISWYVKASNYTTFSQEIYDTTGNNGVSATADLTRPNFAFTAAPYGTGFTSASTTLTTDQYATGAAGNGWYRHTVKFSTTYTSIYVSMYLAVNAAGVINYAGTTGNGIFLSAPQVNYGSTLKTYTASGANGAFSMLAKAGTNAVGTGGVGQSGSQGDIVYQGGNGYTAIDANGGGGGGAAGRIGAGGNAVGMVGGSADNNTLAGANLGGAGSNGTEYGSVGSGSGAGGQWFSGNGYTGGQYGGGGSGSYTTSLATGGAGGDGLIVLTYIRNTYNTIYLTSGTAWRVPNDWTNVNLIEAVGAGGNGAPSLLQSNGQGGGGGAYARVSNIVLAPNSTVSIQIGVAGGTVGYGTSPTANTWFLSGSTLVAAGGQTASGNVIALGGSTLNSIGTVVYAGGNGSAATPTFSGAGGGAGGYSGAGYNGNTSVSGSAGINGSGAVISGPGGKGAAFDYVAGYDGNQGLLYGAGGGGGGGVSYAMMYDYDMQGYSGPGTPGIIAITYKIGKNLYIEPGVFLGPGIIINN